MENDCIFCEIVKGNIPSFKLYEDEHIFAFFTKDMQAKAHTLVIPKKHYKDIFDIDKNDLEKLISVVKKLSIEIKEKLGASGVNIINSSGKDAQQTVYHFHMHIIPRFEGDKVDAEMRKSDNGPFDKEELLKLIKE